MSLFDELEDVTPPTTGEEIGTALAGAMDKIASSNAALAETLSAALTDALERVDSRQVVIDKKDIKRWRFDVHRDANGFITHVVANAT
jgi:hypothetical protein